jgi:hypothetical protein
VQKESFKELDRQAKRELLVDNWAEKSTSLNEDQLSASVSPEIGKLAEKVRGSQAKSIKEWNVREADYSTDESQDGCSCW